MSAAALPLPGQDWSAGGRAAVWAGAAALAVVAHGAVVAAMLARPPAALPDLSAPPAVMIDLAPVPIAPEAPATQLTPDVTNAPEIDATVPEQMVPPAPSPPEPTELAPPPEVPALASPPPDPVTPVTADALPPLDAPVALPTPPEMVRPMSRPEPVKVEKTEEPEPVTPKPPAPSKAAVQSQLQAKPAETVAAPENAAGKSGVSPAKWQARLMAHLERLKRYPPGARKRREEGVAHVRFVIDDGGNVQSARLVRSSGYEELDAAVVALVRRASPVPPPPPGAPHEITAPVRFTVR